MFSRGVLPSSYRHLTGKHVCVHLHTVTSSSWKLLIQGHESELGGGYM